MSCLSERFNFSFSSWLCSCKNLLGNPHLLIDFTHICILLQCDSLITRFVRWRAHGDCLSVWGPGGGVVSKFAVKVSPWAADPAEARLGKGLFQTYVVVGRILTLADTSSGPCFLGGHWLESSAWLRVFIKSAREPDESSSVSISSLHSHSVRSHRSWTRLRTEDRMEIWSQEVQAMEGPEVSACYSYFLKHLLEMADRWRGRVWSRVREAGEREGSFIWGYRSCCHSVI